MRTCQWPERELLFIERTRRGHLQNQARGSRLALLYYYATILRHIDTYRHHHKLRHGHTHESHCAPNRLEQHGGARHSSMSARGVGGATDRNGLSTRKANGAAMLGEVDTTAVAVLLLVWFIAKVREVVGGLLVREEVEQP